MAHDGASDSIQNLHATFLAEVRPAEAPAEDPRHAVGRLVPEVDRNRCEGRADCVRVCPYGVFEVRVLEPADRADLSWPGRIRAWAHGHRQAHVVRPEACDVCQLCVAACPEHAIGLRRLVR